MKSESLKNSETVSVYKEVLDALVDGCCVYDQEGNLLFVNDAFKHLLAIKDTGPIDTHGKFIGYFLGRMSDPDILSGKLNFLENDFERDLYQQVVLKSAAVIEINSFPVNESMQPIRLYYLRDITERVVMERKLRQDATHDPLTGLANRAYLMESLNRAFAIARRTRTYSYGVLFLDLDRFKLINDTYGHALGDSVLLAVADRLKKTVRSSDTIGRVSFIDTLTPQKLDAGNLVARLGGDEFIILLEDLRGHAAVMQILARIESCLQSPIVTQKGEVTVTGCMGLALGNATYQTPEEILRDADTAMYEAKAVGPGETIIFDKSMRAAIVERVELENELRKAIVTDSLQLYYQPIPDIRTGRVAYFEALLRWNHRDRGFIPPSLFIPVAEESRLVLEMGRWVLAQAAKQVAQWKEAGYADIQVSVNVSAAEFEQDNYYENARAILEKENLTAGQIVLELTENVVAGHEEPFRVTMERLRYLGIKIAMDDFGTGYSSLQYLNELPIDILKIDRSFVAKLGTDKGDSLVQTMIAMGKNLNMKIVAEGVETVEQLAYLKARECDMMQGYLFHHAVTAEAATELLANGKKLEH